MKQESQIPEIGILFFMYEKKIDSRTKSIINREAKNYIFFRQEYVFPHRNLLQKSPMNLTREPHLVMSLVLHQEDARNQNQSVLPIFLRH